MTKNGFLKRLSKNKVNNYIYQNHALEGIVSVWKYEDKYILTWEECHIGEQYNEQRYTKDEKYEFMDSDQLINFLDEHNLSIRNFTP